MTQQIINLGTSANAGDGDNLRSAMDKTNDNFTELYGANSVSSNLAFSGQTISSYNTNGDIILGPDGTGTIRIAQDLIPDVNNTRQIGNADVRPLGIYVGTAGITTSGPVTNATYANTTVRDSTITSPQTGMIVAAANVYYGYTGNAWTLLAGADGIAAVVDDTTPQLGGNLDLNSKDITGTGAVNITGNITTTANVSGAYIIGNGSVLTGVVASSVAASDVTGLSTVATTGAYADISGTPTLSTVATTGAYADLSGTPTIPTATSNLSNDSGFIDLADLSVTTAVASGDGSLVYNNGTGVFTFTPADAGLADYGDANVATFLGSNFGSNTVVTTGNVTAANFIGEVTGNVSGSAATATSATTATTAGTVTTAAQPNITSVGTLTSVTVTGNVSGGNVLASANVIATGNVSGTYILGDGSQLTNIPNGVTGNNTEIQYNNNGTLGADAQFTFDSTGGKELVIGAGGGTIQTNNFVGADSVAAPMLIQSDDGAGSKATHVSFTNASGNITTSFSGIVNSTGNITAPNFIGEVTGNVSGSAATATSATTAGTVTANAQPNITSVGTLTSVSVTGNVAGGNLTTGGDVTTVTVTASGAIAGSTTITATGNVAGGNLTTAGQVQADNVDSTNAIVGGTTITATGNVSGGNITTAGAMEATGLISSGTTITATGNITGGNLIATGNIVGTTNGFDIGYLEIPQVVLSANVTAALSDSGKHLYSTTAGNLAVTIPSNANVAFPIGSASTIVVQAAGNVIIDKQAGVSLYLAGNSTDAGRVVSTYGMATVMKVATNVWFISGSGVA